MNDLEEHDLDELSELLVRTLLEPLDDEDFEGELDELTEWLDEERFGMLGHHFGGDDPEMFRELAETGVDPRAVLAYYVALKVELFAAFSEAVTWDRLLLALQTAYSEDLLHDRWVLALEPEAPSPERLELVTTAWRAEAELEIGDVLAPFDQALIAGLEDFSDALHGDVEIDDPETFWERTANAQSSLLKRLKG